MQTVLAGIEADTHYLEEWFLKKTDRVKQDIAKCWDLLRREKTETKENDVVSTTDNSHIIRQLKATFKFYHNFKLTKSILSLESTLHRVDLTSDGRYIYAGGNGCKIRKRDLAIQTNNIFSDKSKHKLKLEYNVFGLALDNDDRCWIHDGHTNQVIGLDTNLKERCLFTGIAFNRK